MKSADEHDDAHLRVFDRPSLPAPDDLEDVFLIGICGTGMGALAGLFQEAGVRVRGSDEAAYPPMSTHLADRGIEVLEGEDPSHLEPAPDLTVVGNACTPTHPEVTYAREHRLPQASFPEALAHGFLTDERRSVVVTGTHGKTTTTGLLVHVLQEAGVDPGFLVGGVMQNTGRSYSLGSGRPFVVEGDEYDSAYFDKRPKFMHYRPDAALVTSLEFDHADIYDGPDDYRQAFEAFVGLLDADDGLLALCGDAPDVRALAAHTAARVRTYGVSADCDVRAADRSVTPDGQRFTLVVDGTAEAEVALPMHGRHNLRNALGVALLALDEGCSPDAIARGLASFEGMKRRQEVRGEPGGVLVLDDFAHHPTAVAATVEAIQQGHPDRRLVAVFEPRSNTSRRAIFEDDYGRAFDAADRVFLKAPPTRHNDDADAMLDPDAVAATIRERGTPASSEPDVDRLTEALADELRPGDIALLMSNGSFDGLRERLLDVLDAREVPS
jgi:UDP-N-acetylmuramate: L-alanyl-gamma-D-glutamyl-meso-diaminopimelate ligase